MSVSDAMVSDLIAAAVAAKAAVGQAEEALVDAKSRCRDTMAALADRAREVPDAEAAWYVYWETWLPATLAAAFLGLPNSHASGVAARLSRLRPPPTRPCNGTGQGNTCSFDGRIPMTSRTDTRYGVCSGCQEARERQRQQEHAAWTQTEQVHTSNVQALRSMPYQEYLRTDHWRTARAGALRRAGYACQVCSAKLDLHVHHRTYERRGCERENDLIVLCRQCHATFHGKLAHS
jgi:5-methylcytosine-specific restriction endonuclease McrA